MDLEVVLSCNYFAVLGTLTGHENLILRLVPNNNNSRCDRWTRINQNMVTYSKVQNKKVNYPLSYVVIKQIKEFCRVKYEVVKM